MKRILLTIIGIAFGMNAGAALAQHDDMPGHDKMPPDQHGKHGKKKDADQKEPPKSDDKQHDKSKHGDADKK